MTTFNIPAGLSAFDEAVAAELPCVSTLEYNSHEICKRFAKNIRERLAAPPVDAVVGEPVGWLRDQREDFEGVEVYDPLFLLGWVPPGPGRKATYSPLYATPAVSRAEGLEPVFYLDEEMAGLLRQTIGDDGEPNAIKLHIGDGHSGHGLYVSLSDYPEEGAIQLVESPAIAPVAPATRAEGLEPVNPHAYWIPSANGLSWRNPAPDASAPRMLSHSVELKIGYGAIAPAAPAEPSEKLIFDMRAQIQHLVDDLVEVLDDDGLPRYRPVSGMMFSNFVSALIRWSAQAASIPDRAGVASLVASEESIKDAQDVAMGLQRALGEQERLTDMLTGMVGRISTALGICEEDQSCANGDEEILFAIEEMRGVEPVAFQYWTVGEFWRETSRLGYEARRDAGDKVRALYTAAAPATSMPVHACVSGNRDAEGKVCSACAADDTPSLLASEPAVSEWQSIDSAPKDAHILLRIDVAIGSELVVQGCWYEVSKRDRGWMDMEGRVVQVTHWQLLPSAPVTPGESA